MTTEVKVARCLLCPFCLEQDDILVCVHPSYSEPEELFGYADSVPDDCPLKDGPITISLE